MGNNAPTKAQVLKENLTIETEYNYMIRQQCTYYFAQCFEALETFGKDVAFQHILFNNTQIFYDKKAVISITERNQLPGGKGLRKLVKRFCEPMYSEYSKSNYHKLDFDLFFCMLSDTRDAIVQAGGLIITDKVNPLVEKNRLINMYFNLAEHDDDKTFISSDIVKLKKLIKHLSEISYQIYKILNIKDEFKWSIIPNYNFSSDVD